MKPNGVAKKNAERSFGSPSLPALPFVLKHSEAQCGRDSGRSDPGAARGLGGGPARGRGEGWRHHRAPPPNHPKTTVVGPLVFGTWSIRNKSFEFFSGSILWFRLRGTWFHGRGMCHVFLLAFSHVPLEVPSLKQSWKWNMACS